MLPVTLFMAASLLSSSAVVVALASPMYDVEPFKINSLRVNGPVEGLFIPDSKEKTIALALAAGVLVITLSMLVNFVDKAISRTSHLITASICVALAFVSIILLDQAVSLPAAEALKNVVPGSVVRHTETYIVTYTLLASAIACLMFGMYRHKKIY